MIGICNNCIRGITYPRKEVCENCQGTGFAGQAEVAVPTLPVGKSPEEGVVAGEVEEETPKAKKSPKK